MDRRSTATTGGQDVATVFATQAGVIAFGLLIQSLLAHVLLPEGRGIYAVSIALSGVLAVLCTPGSNTGAQYLVMAKRLTVSSGTTAAVMIGMVGSGLGILLALPLMSRELPFLLDGETRRIALILIPVNIFTTTADLLLTGLRRFTLLGVLSVARSAAHALILFLLMRVQGTGVDGAIVALAAANLLMIAATFRYLVRHHQFALRMPSRVEFRAVLGYGVRYHAARVGAVVGRNAGVLLLGLIASPADAGLFAAANALMARFGTIATAVGSALLSRVAVGTDGRPELVARCVRIVGFATAAAVGVFCAVSIPVIRLLLSDAFLPAAPLIWILAPGVIANGTSGIFTVYLRGTDRPELCSWSVWIGLAVNVAVVVLLYRPLGARAAALALTAGMVCRNLFLDLAYRKATQTSWSALWLPRRADGPFLWSAVSTTFRPLFARRPS